MPAKAFIDAARLWHTHSGEAEKIVAALCEFCFCARNQVAAARSLLDELNPLSSWRDLSLSVRHCT